MSMSENNQSRETAENACVIQLRAEKAGLEVVEGPGLLTSGARNVYECRFEFDEAWEGLDKTVVFRVDGTSVSCLPDGQGQCMIPWEVLERDGEILYTGVYGSRGTETVLPTVWAQLGVIEAGVIANEAGEIPETRVYEEILAAARGAERTANTALDGVEVARQAAQGAEASAREAQMEAKACAVDAKACREEYRALMDRVSGNDILIETPAAQAVSMEDCAERVMVSLRVYGQSEQVGRPGINQAVPVESLGEAKELEIILTGKNLCANVLEFDNAVIGADGGFTKANGCYVSGPVYTWGHKSVLSVAKLPERMQDGMLRVGMYGKNGKFLRRLIIRPAAGTSVQIAEDVLFLRVSGYRADFLDAALQVEFGPEVTEQEPCRAAAVQFGAGLPLRGLPVSAGGNLTIDGQAYAADTLELNADGTGRVIRRIRKRRMLPEDQWVVSESGSYLYTQAYTDFAENDPHENYGGTVALCSHLPVKAYGDWIGDQNDTMLKQETGVTLVHDYKTPEQPFRCCVTCGYGVQELEKWKTLLEENEIWLYYETKEWEEVPLTGKDVEAMAELKLCRGKNIVGNSLGGWMNVEYCADPKLYIDGKFQELAAAIRESAGNTQT